MHRSALTLHLAGYTVHESCTWTLHLTNQPNLTKYTLALLNASHKPLDGVRQPALPSAQPCDAQPRPPSVPDLKTQTRPSPHPTVNKPHTHTALHGPWHWCEATVPCCSLAALLIPSCAGACACGGFPGPPPPTLTGLTGTPITWM